MKIYTKTGDAGTTSLVGGERVSKCSPRVCAYGDVDELISWIGMVRCDLPASMTGKMIPTLSKIQEDLMLASAHLAAGKEIPKLAPLKDEAIEYLESEIDDLTAQLPPLTSFVIPGEPRVSAQAHVARTVCRRAERSALSVPELTAADRQVVRYLNRLSDYLFTLARYLCVEGCGKNEEHWIPAK